MKLASTLADVLPAHALSDVSGEAAAVHHGRTPEAVVRPRATEEVAATLEWAAAGGIGVLTVGSGRRWPVRPLDRPFVLLRTDRLSGVEVYEPADMTLTARAGTPLDELEGRLAAHGQWLPFDPPHADQRSLGGLVASGESGPSWMGYGELRNHVLGATVVTGDGRTLRLGGRVVKNVAGFDLLKPIVGSRGRLAVVTSVCVRAFPRPAEERVLVLRGATAEELCDVARMVGTAPVLPVSSVLAAPLPVMDAPAALLVRLHGAPQTVEADQLTLERHCGVTFERPENPRSLLVAARDAASEGPLVVVSVLPARLREALAAVTGLLGRAAAGAELVADTYQARIRMSGVAADGAAASRLRDAVEGLGGSLRISPQPMAGSGDAPPATLPGDTAELVAGLERVFDPKGVFWPCRP